MMWCNLPEVMIYFIKYPKKFYFPLRVYTILLASRTPVLDHDYSVEDKHGLINKTFFVDHACGFQEMDSIYLFFFSC